jgi:hypothetical protein
MTDLEALVVAAYVFADEYRVPARGGRPALVTDGELVALAVAQAAIGISSDRQFLGLIARLLPGWFPHLPEQSQYNRRLRGLGRAALDRATADRTLDRPRRQGLLGPRLRRPSRCRRHHPAHPNKSRTAANLGRERALASTRPVIESVFANLKGQMRLEHHLAKTPAGLAARIAQRILALSLGVLLNTLTGRPARALAAYDGR